MTNNNKMVEKVLEINRERTIFWSLLGSLLISALFYIYFVNITVHNTVARQNFEAESSSLSLKISTNEFEYITKRNNVTLALAKSLGFKEAKVTAYVKTKTPGVAFLDR